MDWENKLRLKIKEAESIIYLIVFNCLMHLQVSEKVVYGLSYVALYIIYTIYITCYITLYTLNNFDKNWH